MNFISGVTLLNMYLISNNIPIWSAILIGFIMLFLIWVLSFTMEKSWQKWLYRGIFGVAILFLMTWISLYPTFWINYEVTIDNDVSYVELSNNYGTDITQNGEIYTIRGEIHHDWIWNMKEYENAELGKLSER